MKITDLNSKVEVYERGDKVQIYSASQNIWRLGGGLEGWHGDITMNDGENTIERNFSDVPSKDEKRICFSLKSTLFF